MIKKTLIASMVALAALNIFNSCEKEDKDAVTIDQFQAGIVKIKGSDGKTYEAVDMGFPSGTLWATCNMGATSPEQNGNYYAWGETETKTSYSIDNYKWYADRDQYKITKYCTNDERGYIDHIVGKIDKKTALDSIDNAVIVNMGSNWNMPTMTEYKELLYRTTCRWCKLNGVYGYMFTSTEKGYTDRSIFLPMGGQFDEDTNDFIGKFGFYWTRTIYSGETYSASVLQMDHKTADNITVTNTRRERYLGLPVRPIANKYLLGIN